MILALAHICKFEPQNIDFPLFSNPHIHELIVEFSIIRRCENYSDN